MYGIFTYIYHQFMPNVGKYTSRVDAMGLSFEAAAAAYIGVSKAAFK